MNNLTIDLEKMRNDKSEGSYYYSWQANIAMAFKDVYWETIQGRENAPSGKEIHDIANIAAKRFLDSLIFKPEPDQKGS